MKAKARFPRRAVLVSEIPGGEYQGHWCGYVVTFTASDCNEYEAETDIGVRGRVDVIVTVDADKGTISVKERNTQ